MLIHVRVTSNAKEAKVTKTGETSFEVRVDEKSVGGRANKRLLDILSEHFNTPRSRIAIVRGSKIQRQVNRDSRSEVFKPINPYLVWINLLYWNAAIPLKTPRPPGTNKSPFVPNSSLFQSVTPLCLVNAA